VAEKHIDVSTHLRLAVRRARLWGQLLELGLFRAEKADDLPPLRIVDACFKEFLKANDILLTGKKFVLVLRDDLLDWKHETRSKSHSALFDA
jgi:hypothetical protein